ncbi:MAG TPA: hypothetical protein VNO14_09625, partial [Blastocatellia bacterium]|nr:hypothetical protein [Blastocatellia bacterium]
MPHNFMDLSALEEMREAGDYDRLAALLEDDWERIPEFEENAIRLRMLVAELHGRSGRLDEMEACLLPYLNEIGRVPFSLIARVLLTLAIYHYRRNEPSEALRLASQAKTVAEVRDDEFTASEAVQLQGQALWSLEKWEDANQRFHEAINLYAGQSRTYRLGLACLCMGAVLNRMGRVEEARTGLERGIKILLKCQDEYNLAIARVNVALPLNAIGEYDTALKYLLFAHEKFEQMGHEQYSYLTLNSIAATLIRLKEYERAESCIMRALEKGIAARSTQIASTYEIKARLHLARREWECAEKALQASIDIAEQANSLSQKAEARRTLGRLYLAQDRETEAASVLWRALDIAQELQASLLEVEIKALLAQAICKTDPVEAFRLISDVDA